LKLSELRDLLDEEKGGARDALGKRRSWWRSRIAEKSLHTTLEVG